MTQTIYLHIGHYKTGTTALQAAMRTNARSLSRQGLHYVSGIRYQDKHSGLVFSILRAAGVTELMHGYAHKTPPQAVWNKLFDEARQFSGKDIVVSTEEFMRIGAYPDAREILREIIAPVRAEFDFRIIVYLRAPLSHLQSWYNQLVKMNIGPVPSFNAAVCDLMEPVHYDYAQALAPWIDIFGPDALIVRPYTDDLRQEGALFADFLSVFDMVPSMWTKAPSRVSNPRMDDNQVEIARVMQAAGASEELIARVQGRASRLREETKRGSGTDMLDVAARAREGLDALAALPGNSVDAASFAQELPLLNSDTHGEDIATLTDLVVFLFVDINLLRTNLHNTQAGILKRLVALEKGTS